MVQYQLPMGLRYAAHRRGGGRIDKPIRNSESTLAGILEKNFYKNWSTCRPCRTAGEIFGGWGGSSDLNKRNNITQQSVIFQLVWYIISVKKQTRLNLPLHMIWADRIDNLVVDMTPLVGIPSSLVGEESRSLEWSSISWPARILVVQ